MTDQDNILDGILQIALLNWVGLSLMCCRRSVINWPLTESNPLFDNKIDCLPQVTNLAILGFNWYQHETYSVCTWYPFNSELYPRYVSHDTICITHFVSRSVIRQRTLDRPSNPILGGGLIICIYSTHFVFFTRNLHFVVDFGVFLAPFIEWTIWLCSLDCLRIFDCGNPCWTFKSSFPGLLLYTVVTNGRRSKLSLIWCW